MQPSLRRARPIGQDLRPERPLDYSRLSDPIVITRAKAGDRRALEELCSRHAPRVERLARHLLVDPEDARDAGQDALAKICTRLGQFRGESAFSTWLHRLVVNVCRDVAARRLAQRCEELVEDGRASPDPGPARAAELAELRAELRQELAGLPADQARVVVLKDALGFSFPEISAASGMPVGTAKCYAHRARAGLRDRLEPRAA
jgi:RNA polymerase sigma-70 factor (ECF subfamily)